MTLKECYRILGVETSTSLEEIKHAYRRRAFELHPDLNPHLSDAGHQFQLLNEAYVILSRLAAVREAREERLRSESEKRHGEGASNQEAKAAENKHATTAASGSTKAEAESEGAQKTSRAAESKRPDAKQEEAGTRETPPRPGADEASASPDPKQAASEEQGTSRPSKENLYTEQQEVLRDILNDPFARRVFEDIYSEIRKKGKPGPKTVSKPASPKPMPSRPSKGLGDLLHHNWGLPKSPIDFSQGMGGAVKNWLRSQIDEEQTFHLPAARLFPGARIRLQIRRGLSDSLTTVEVTLPPDFAVGKPIRLKGMGKKVGRWQGDLYLRLMAGN